jgi:AcrR family transcriptional regulator
MGRRPDPERRQELLEAVVDYLLANGMHDVSLRSLAEAIGTSARMLVYHFDTKQDLFAAALDEARCRQRLLFSGWIAPVASESYPITIHRAWGFFESEQALAYHRLFQQLAALSREPGSPYEGFAARTALDWLPMVQAGFAASGADPESAASLATMTLAAVRGLIMDLLATNDVERVRLGCEALVDLLADRLAAPRHAGRAARSA